MKFIKYFDQIGIEDVDNVGGKNASLGEMYQNLLQSGVKVPYGFAITVDAYNYLLDENNLLEKLHNELDTLDPDNVAQLQERAKKCRGYILEAKIPDDLRLEILQAYKALQERYGTSITLAVRSSATAEDSPEASFAGQNETYLNIANEEELLNAYKSCIASNFTDRSIHYKYDNNFEYLKVYLSVTVMKMVRSDLAASGVMFSIDTESGFEDVVLINGAYGLGENVVQGSVDPDNFYVHKPTLEKGYKAVLKRSLGSKKIKMIHTSENVDVPEEDRKKYCISDEDIVQLAEYAINIEKHYSKKAGYRKPMDIEWAKDGEDGELYIVQARPETVESRQDKLTYESYKLKEQGELLVSGSAVGRKIASGKVRKINDISELSTFKAGEVLVAETTTPDWEPVMKIAAAIVTNRGGRTCHAAIISRELGIPAVVGCDNATEVLHDADSVTVDCAEGEIGHVYEGALEFEVLRSDLSEIKETKTKIMMNLGNPDLAFSLSSLPVDGIGLARMEFIINQSIKAHPMALIHPEKLDEEAKKAVTQITHGEDAKEFFVRNLSEGVATIAASVYPKPCVVRMSDFKTNEYADLLGGKFFEPVDANPMIGFRGAARYSHPAYEEGFALECAAMKRVRDEMGFTNVILMIPFCRRVAEGEKVIATMEKYGLKRGENGLEIYVMCEIPNNVMSIDGFSKSFDGFSIGSNDLTQLTLGVDRDSEIVAFDYDERDEGVLKMIELAVEGSKRNNRHSGICGQAPSDYPEMAEYLVKLGIDSISLNPDSVIKTRQNVAELEAKLGI
ncbi:phosphoenolpyruvate synthase [Sulfurimonas sp. C5]|uniref:phosphoenolpyruvate synthase n=1 Tax=Sulfurimonas sp. C5 TaxID=3036947 RepID=UPI002453FC2A|nr:phosphoenolpyruvate synthase [Sulfurimonas sp. C5]MDH4943840.1 phosphoenolpyruvate synthase [Sulfurimonas sp. C5]